MNRISLMLHALNWPQPKMADYLGCRQPTISRLVNGQPETGAQSKLLDILEREMREGQYGDDARCALESSVKPDPASRPPQPEAAE